MWAIGSRLQNSSLYFLFIIAMLTIISWWIAIFIVGLLIGSLLHDSLKSRKIKGLERSLEFTETKLATTNAELEWQKLARKLQTQKYDELYTRLLAVNAQNAKLTKKLQELTNPELNPKVEQEVNEVVKAQLLSHSFSKEMWDAVYNLFLRGATRREIADKYGVSYSTICKIIMHKDRKQDPLF